MPSLAAHPIRGLFDAGVRVTVNTDDPAMFGTSLALEYALLIERLGFTPAEIRALVLTAVDVAWLPARQRAELAAAVAGDPAWARPVPLSSR